MERNLQTRSTQYPANEQDDTVSKVSKIYDLTRLITPVTAAMKISLHTLVQRKLNWDNAIPDDLDHPGKHTFK